MLQRLNRLAFAVFLVAAMLGLAALPFLVAHEAAPLLAQFAPATHYPKHETALF